MGKSSTNTVQSASQPPSNWQSALNSFLPQVQKTASAPYQDYGGQMVAQFNPTQGAAFGEVANAQGAANPYIKNAASYINASTAPLASSIPQPFDAAIRSGQIPGQALGATMAASGPAITQATQAGQSGIYGASQSFNPSAVQKWQDPYTQQVVNATQAQFNNQNAQAQSALAGDAISKGAWGGDRAGVAQGIAAGQESLAQAPVIAGLEDKGYQTALGAAQAASGLNLQGATAAGQLGLSGAQAQAQQQQTTAQQLLGLTTGQQNLELGANEANAWLNSQAGYGMANLGNEALNTSLTGANALLSVGNQAQQQDQANLNVPYQQWIARQAYPFQTTGWLGSELEGAAGAAGGTSSTTSPAANPWSQALGAGLTTAGIANQTGAFGSNGWLSNLGGSSAATSAGADFIPAGTQAASDLQTAYSYGQVKRGGAIQDRSLGGNVVHFPHAGRSGLGGANDNWMPRSEAPRMRAAGGGMGYADGGGAQIYIDPDAFLGTDSSTTTPSSAIMDYLDTHTGATPPPAARGPVSPLIPPAYGMPPGGSSPLAPPQRIGEGAGWGPVPSGASSAPPRSLGAPRGVAQQPGFSGPPQGRGAPPPPAASPDDAAPGPSPGPQMAAPSAGMGPPSSGSGTDWGKAALYAGLGILSGRSPNALTNVGEGGLEGLRLYDAEKARQTQADSTTAYKLAQEQNLQSQEAHRQAQEAEDLRHHRLDEANTTKHLSDMAEEARARLGMEGGNLAETHAFHQAELSKKTFVGTDESGMPLFADSQGNITTGTQKIGLKPADAARAATSAANTAETSKWHAALSGASDQNEVIRLIQANPSLAAMPAEQGVAEARKALGKTPPAAPTAAAGNRPPLSAIFGQ